MISRKFFGGCLILGALSLFFPTSSRAEWSGQLKDLLAREPQSLVLETALGETLKREGNLSGALQVFADALERNPGEPVLLAQMGDVTLLLGKYETARELFKRLLSGNPKSLDGLYGLVKVDKALLNFSGAKLTCGQILELFPDNYFAILNLAWSEFCLKNFEKAVEWYSKEPHSGDKILRMGKGWSLYKLNKLAEAQSVFQGLKAQFPSDPDCQAALIEVEKKRASEAIPFLAAGSRISADEKKKYLESAGALLSAGKPGEALELGFLVLDDDPENPDAARIIAESYRGLGNYAKADYYYSVLLNRQVTPLALTGKITSLRALGQFFDAASFSRDLISLEKQNVLALQTLGDFHYQTGQFDQALNFYLQANSTETVILQAIGWSYLNAKKLQEAKKVFEGILETEPKNPFVLEGMKVLSKELGKH